MVVNGRSKLMANFLRDSELRQILITCDQLSNKDPSVESRLNGSLYISA